MDSMETKKRALFIDRDGTLIVEPPVTEQVDDLEQLEFLPGVLRNLYFLRQNTTFELVIVSNQDGLGTPDYPQENFDRVQNKMLQIFESEGVTFDNIIIDVTREEEHSPTRKPGTALLTQYLNGDYDLKNSYVIGDRLTDMQLANNLVAMGSCLLRTERLHSICLPMNTAATSTHGTKSQNFSLLENVSGKYVERLRKPISTCASILMETEYATSQPDLDFSITCLSRLGATPALTLPYTLKETSKLMSITPLRTLPSLWDKHYIRPWVTKEVSNATDSLSRWMTVSVVYA